jgi:hypothetical protein
MGLGSGTGIIQVTEASMKTPGYNAVEARIRELGVAVIETRQDRALVVHGDAKGLAALLKEPFVEAAMPYAPAFKLDPVAGKQMLLDKVRASKMELDVHIRTWKDQDVDALLKDLKSIHSDTVSLLDDGKTIRATLDKNELKRVLKMDQVSEVREIPEYQLSANFVLLQDPPVVQVGESEHTFAATPYWDAGVDGGGCGYCSNAFATACTSDMRGPRDLRACERDPVHHLHPGDGGGDPGQRSFHGCGLPGAQHHGPGRGGDCGPHRSGRRPVHPR